MELAIWWENMEELLTHAFGYASEEPNNDTQNIEAVSVTGTESGPLIWDGEWDRSDSI